MRRRQLIVGIAIVSGVLVAGAAFLKLPRDASSASIPSASDSMAAILHVYENAKDDYATSEDFDLTCEVAATRGNCEALLGSAPEPPTTPPHLVCDDVYPGESALRAGRIMVVAGEGRDGRRYLSEILAISDQGRTVLMNPAFWVSSRVTNSGITGDIADVVCEGSTPVP